MKIGLCLGEFKVEKALHNPNLKYPNKNPIHLPHQILKNYPNPPTIIQSKPT